MIQPDPLVIIDLEATCDEPKPAWESEIIEIGVCILDLGTFEIHHAKSILVKPETSPITPFCTTLTTITQEMLDKDGVSLKEAMDILVKEYFPQTGARQKWGSWGDYDRKMFLRDCLAKDIEFPGVGSQHINLKQTIADHWKWKKGIGMAQALKHFNLPLLGTHHRGLDDAINIAKITVAHKKAIRREAFFAKAKEIGEFPTGLLAGAPTEKKK